MLYYGLTGDYIKENTRLRLWQYYNEFIKYSFSPFIKGKNEIFDHDLVTLDTPHVTTAKQLRFKKYENPPKIEVSDFYGLQ